MSMAVSIHRGAVARSLFVATLTAVSSGCYAETEAEPAYVDATVAPGVDVELYPQDVYDGHPVYYMNDHWYTRDRGRWDNSRPDPPALYRRRLHVARAPRARESERGRYREREEHRHGAERRGPRHEAPPARRVR